MQDPKQGYNHAQFFKPPLYSIRQKSNVKVSVKSKTRQLFPMNMCNSTKLWYIPLPTWRTEQSYKVST